MPDDPTPSEVVDEAALLPRKATGDNGSVENHPLPDLIEWEKHQAGKAVQSTGRLGIKFHKIVPGGPA